MGLTPEQRVLRARLAACVLHAAGKTNTVPAIAAWRRRFEDQVDPDRTLPPDERERRVRLAIRAHMTALALRSSQARKAARR
jgi:hypothetical protein